MTRPCEVIVRVEGKTRTIVFKKKRKASFVSFDSPSHCDTCASAIALYKSAKPHNETDE